MKTLLLMRHAKSSWNDPSLADHDRPLKPRGVRAAQRMGQLLVAQSLIPDIVVCSTAVRAMQTWEQVAAVLDSNKVNQPHVDYQSRLYHCAPEVFVEVLSELEASVETALLIGHNPGLEDGLQHLLGHHERFPTAALAKLSFAADSWSTWQAVTPTVRLEHLWRPRELDEPSERGTSVP